MITVTGRIVSEPKMELTTSGSFYFSFLMFDNTTDASGKTTHTSRYSVSAYVPEDAEAFLKKGALVEVSGAFWRDAKPSKDTKTGEDVQVMQLRAFRAKAFVSQKQRAAESAAA